MPKRLMFGIIAIVIVGVIIFLVRGYLAPQPAQARPIPHQLAGREDCLSCHGPGINEATRTSHPERTKCTLCHEPAK